jgi:2-keto-3-deoxy-L-rhamnonate aldolase RhmA
MADRGVKSIKYFNGGIRGLVNVGYTSSFTPSKEEDYRRSDDQTVIVVQIESKKGADNIDEIPSVPGIDVVVVGRGDMAHSIGVTGNMNDPKVNAMVDSVFEAAKRHNIVSGLMCPTVDKGVQIVKSGAKFINFANEQTILMRAYNEFLKEVRAAENK